MSVRDLKDLCEKIEASGSPLLFRGGGSKSPHLGRETEDPDCSAEVVDVAALSGISLYQPSEYTITASAGTRLEQLAVALQEHRQYLPFDPLLVESGATVGGTVAANAGGPGRFRHGGVRDFVLGVRFVNGEGQQVSGGAKVVKNAAGFDLPKLMTGSLGTLGCLTEVTFKVFPAPPNRLTLLVHQLDNQAADALMHSLLLTPFEFLAMDLHASAVAGSNPLWTLAVRIGGPRAGLVSRSADLEAWGRARAVSDHDVELLDSAEDASFWRRTANLSWVAEQNLAIKVPLTLPRFQQIEQLGVFAAMERVFSATQQLWISVHPDQVEQVDRSLQQIGLAGQVVRFEQSESRASAATSGLAATSRVLVGEVQNNAFGERVRHAFDPRGRFADPCAGHRMPSS